MTETKRVITYAGIGSRETPDVVLSTFMKIGSYLAGLNFVLRSGGAEGADSAFEEGCDLKDGFKEIYLPWKDFNNKSSELVVGSVKEAKEIAKKYHTHWDNLSYGAKLLATRNVFQVLGLDLNTPSDLVICYTPNGILLKELS